MWIVKTKAKYKMLHKFKEKINAVILPFSKLWILSTQLSQFDTFHYNLESCGKNKICCKFSKIVDIFKTLIYPTPYQTYLDWIEIYTGSSRVYKYCIMSKKITYIWVFAERATCKPAIVFCVTECLHWMKPTRDQTKIYTFHKGVFFSFPSSN